MSSSPTSSSAFGLEYCASRPLQMAIVRRAGCDELCEVANCRSLINPRHALWMLIFLLGPRQPSTQFDVDRDRTWRCRERAPRGSVGRRSAAVRDVSATSNGRPPPWRTHQFNRRLKARSFFVAILEGYPFHKKTGVLGLDFPVCYYLARCLFQGGVCEAYRS
jgi:hypothetical protein